MSNCFDCSQLCAIQHHRSLAFSTLLSQTAEKASQIIDDVVRRLKQDGGHLKNDLDGWTTWDNVIAMLEEYKSFSALGNQCTDKSDPNHATSLNFHIKNESEEKGCDVCFAQVVEISFGTVS